MPKVNLRISGGDVSVHYDVTGSGPGLLLIHGTGATREQWAPLVEAVRDRFTVVAPDYSGSGLTTDHGGPLTVEDLAAEMLAAASDAGLDRFHVVGHSLGAAVAAHLAGTRPEKVASLVLHAGWVHTDARLDAEFRLWLEVLDTAPGLFARMLPLMAFGTRYWSAADAASNEAVVAALAANLAPGVARQTEVDRTVDLRAVLPAITAPTLVLASAQDRLIPAAQQRELLARIPRTRYAEVDAGHGAHAEHPEAFWGLVTAFLDEQLPAVPHAASTR
ncbi:alpha/beta hydrolase [Amycolatopsis cynarae]|uniref:Alpha/beta hydrolase n=1 Tax=Amycolatopsis cynarae TaxID=2995223 RepID=A0ABY7AVT2_9PSEU|nr:alpha/beta hydrolase [Amycolatopsis sp. HUAS 11-8]WAL64091.1 alpha/beta hydrolase [Amycolatopsis sp. HUAS 11-8]